MQEKYNRLLAERGLRTAYVARQTGIPYNTLNDWRKGRTKKISAENLEKLAQFFDVPVEYFNDATFVETYERNPYMDRIRYYVDKLVSMKDEDREMVESMIERLSNDKAKD